MLTSIVVIMKDKSFFEDEVPLVSSQVMMKKALNGPIHRDPQNQIS